jgi:hypothetical protein
MKFEGLEASASCNLGSAAEARKIVTHLFSVLAAFRITWRSPNSHKASMIGGQALGHHYGQSFGK